MLSRRHFLGKSLRSSLAGGLAWAQLPSHAQDVALESVLRAGAAVLVLRHALAPGTFDPPGFRLDACGTQRNLSEEGRVQARRLGAWFRARKLQPVRVLASPWCRCVDTANLAFGRSEVWSALGSPQGAADALNETHRGARRQALAAASAAAQQGRFEVWVTHMFVVSDMANTGVGSGEGLVLRDRGNETPQVLAQFPTV